MDKLCNKNDHLPCIDKLETEGVSFLKMIFKFILIFLCFKVTEL